MALFPPKGARRDPWVLRPREHLSPRVLSREPLLADLENNAIYRAMVMKDRTGPGWLRMPSFLKVIAIVVVILVSSVAGFFLPLLILAILVRRRMPGDAAGFLSIHPTLLDDLVDAPLELRDWSRALWGRAMKARSGLNGSIVMSAIVLVYILPSSLLIIWRNSAEMVPWRPLITGIAGAILAGWAAPWFMPPHTRLPSLRRRLFNARRQLERRRSASAWFGSVVSTILLAFMVYAGIALGVSVFAMIVIYGLKFISWKAVVKLCSQGWAPYAAFIFGAVVVALAVRLRVAYCARWRESSLWRIEDEMSKILNLIREAREPGDAPKPAFSPGGRSVPSPKARPSVLPPPTPHAPAARMDPVSPNPGGADGLDSG